MIRFKIKNYQCPHCKSTEKPVAIITKQEYREVFDILVKDGFAEVQIGYEDLAMDETFDLEQYQCPACEAFIANSDLGVYEWLKERNMLEPY